MDKNDAELTRKAIEEILREAKEHKEKDELPRINQERKINPLRKTNKHFLGRTLNAVMKHNERHEDRNRRKCRKKLRELNNKRRRHDRSESSNNYRSKRSRKRKAVDVSTESDDSSNCSKRKPSKLKRKKKHKRKKRERRGSSSSSSSSSSNSCNNQMHPNRNADNEVGYDAANVEMQNYTENLAAWMIQPMLWTAQMQQLYQYKALMDMSATQANQTETVQIEELSLSSASLSDVNFEEVVEAKPSLRNVMLTINLSTDEEKEPEETSKSSGEEIAEKISSIEVNDSDSSPIIEIKDSDADDMSEGDKNMEVNDSLVSLKSVDSNTGVTVDLTED